MNTSPATALSAAREARRIAAVDYEWKAVEAILGDVHARTIRPEPAGAACGFVMTDGADPVFRFDPYEAVRRMSPGTPETAWHNESEFILRRIARVTQLAASWDPEAKVIILAPRPPELETMFVHIGGPSARRQAPAKKIEPAKPRPRGDNVFGPPASAPDGKPVPAPGAPAPRAATVQPDGGFAQGGGGLSA